MDEELKQLAMLALLNAFWRDFSALCNKYVIAGYRRVISAIKGANL